jgi:autophagy-related protein 17
MASSALPASPSPQQSRPSSIHNAGEFSAPVETLVQHLLDAKRSLSTMTLVLGANELVTAARQAHEESVVLGAQTQFLRRGISDQVRLLIRARKSMTRTYDSGKREFKQIIRDLDAANGGLEETMNILRGRQVESALRPQGEGAKNLLDFVDVEQVDTMRQTLKESIGALQAIQTSFDGDLLRFDTDLRTLNKTISAVPPPTSPSASSAEEPVTKLLADMMGTSHEMAQLLASLTKHFDLCVTAVRSTEGGTDLARRKAAEVAQTQGGGDDVSLSNVIAEQESHMEDLDPISAEDREQMLQVVEQDASEVADVVQEINERLQDIQEHFGRLDEQTNRTKAAYLTTLEAFRVLEDIGSRLHSYIDAEAEFRERWHEENLAIADKMAEMEELRLFYERYAGAYDSLLLEVERRRAHEERVLGIWRKAKDSVDKVVESDRKQRESFRQEVGDYIPTDLWPGMEDSMQRWEIVPVRGGEGTERMHTG